MLPRPTAAPIDARMNAMRPDQLSVVLIAMSELRRLLEMVYSGIN